MRKHVFLVAALGAIALALLSGAGASGCDNSKGGTGQGGTQEGHILKACDTHIVKKVARIGHGTAVEAETKSTCAPPPQSHVVLITIQYHPTNSTHYVTMGTKFCNAKPVPGIDTDCHITLPGVCHVGIWRVTVLVTGQGPNGTPFSYPLPRKPTTKITSCSY